MTEEDGLPVGLQVLAPALADDRLDRVGARWRCWSSSGPMLEPDRLDKKLSRRWPMSTQATELMSYDDELPRTTRPWGSRCTSS